MQKLEATGLRIGNYVDAEIGLPSLHAHKICSKDIGSIHNGEVIVYPIPLTEEILLKCGFEKTDDYGDQKYYEPKVRGNRNYYICFDHEAISFGLVSFGNCTNLLYDDLNLQHLHQLQNLIFALTGQELEINL